jgi:hypothetical protein
MVAAGQQQKISAHFALRSTCHIVDVGLAHVLLIVSYIDDGTHTPHGCQTRSHARLSTVYKPLGYHLVHFVQMLS